MYGTLLSNTQIERLLESSNFTLSPYRPERVKLAHYKLSPARIAEPGRLQPDGTRGHPREIGSLRYGAHVFEPRQYLMVEVEETILLPEGIVGTLTPASTLVEQGFGLVAGKLDSDYGRLNGERFIVGLVNLLDEPNPYHPQLGLAHISFTDFRGTERRPIKFSTQQKRDFKDRRWDDGPDYHRDDPE